MVGALVAAHHRAGALAQGVHEREGVELVQGAVVDVGADGFAQRGPAAAELLLVEQPVLGGGDDAGVLDAAGDGAHAGAGEVRVVAEALPVAAAAGDTAERTCNRAQGDVDALAVVLGAKGAAVLQHEVPVESGGQVDAGREGRDELLAPDAVGAVGKAQGGHAEAGDLACVSHAGAWEAAGNVDLLLDGHLGDQGPRLAEGGGPADIGRSLAACFGAVLVTRPERSGAAGVGCGKGGSRGGGRQGKGATKKENPKKKKTHEKDKQAD